MATSETLPVANTGALRAWESFRATTHFGSLDGLRCLSILAVIWHHGPGGSLRGLAGRGFLGVTLFFAISGFLITTLLLREHDRNAAISLRKFYIRRSLRIFPLYFGVLGVYCVLVYAVAPGTDRAREFFANLPYFLTYTSNWFVDRQAAFAFAWSLAAEEQFYSTWPSALRFLRPMRAVWLMAALLAAAMLSHALTQKAPLSGGLTAANLGLVVLRNVPLSICWGCLAAFALHYRRSFALVWKVVAYRWTPLALLAVVTIVASFWRVDIPISFLFAVLVAACVIREDHILAAAMRQRWVVHMGVISYGMYLLHGLVFDLLGRVAGTQTAHSVGGFFVVLAGTVLVATLSFRFFETPFLRLKSRFTA